MSRVRYAIVADVTPSSVRCLSRSHILKTVQDRPMVTMEHCREVAIADSVAAFTSSLRCSSRWGDILVSDTKYVEILLRLLFDVGVRLQLLSAEQCCQLL